jgi:cytoskeletal protein CcmA (bactofilin family)
MFQSNNKSSSLGTILAPEIEIKGDITISDNIIIYGKVNGNIHSNGNINTAEGSVITGDITAKSLSISGTINGNLDIEEKVILNSSGCLNGNIKANIISIDEGASFEGMCNMLNHNETKVQKISNLSS